MSRVGSVCALSHIHAYCRIDVASGKNLGWDRAAVDTFMTTGTDAELLPEAGWTVGAAHSDMVWTSGQGVLVSTRLRALLQDLAPDDLDFRPCQVDEQPYWFMRVTTERDAALDLPASGARFGPRRKLQQLDSPIWIRAALHDVGMFRISLIESRVWVTDTVAAACLSSRYTGLRVAGPYGRIR